MENTDKEVLIRPPLEIARAVESLLRGAIFFCLRMFYTLYRYLLIRRRFPFSSESDTSSAAIIIGPFTFAVFSWILNLSGIFIMSFGNPKSPDSLFEATMLILADGIMSGNPAKFLLAISPILITIVLVAALQWLICQVLGGEISFDTNLSIAGYVLGTYAFSLFILIMLYFPFIISRTRNYVSIPMLIIFVFIIFLWTRRWFRMLIEHDGLNRIKSVFTIGIVISLTVSTYWFIIKAVLPVLNRYWNFFEILGISQ
ncbi:hypothetical protein [uncultured Desulfosarcina sp.]|uniref:hypothetical protein n=1 Tax=uncultured Desulfosarcina sp. TaxID=218289 RepID=UPI0029C7B206|nr:hypothetical protein [uncultured Desulfosarcina sp.]